MSLKKIEVGMCNRGQNNMTFYTRSQSTQNYYSCAFLFLFSLFLSLKRNMFQKCFIFCFRLHLICFCYLFIAPSQLLLSMKTECQVTATLSNARFIVHITNTSPNDCMKHTFLIWRVFFTTK